MGALSIAPGVSWVSGMINAPPSTVSVAIVAAVFLFQTYIQHRFAQGKIHRYVMDLYLDSSGRVWIVDSNIWGERTDGLLFDWKESMALGAQVGSSKEGDDETSYVQMPEMRAVTKNMKSMTYDPLSSYRGPTDVMNILNSGNGDNGGYNMPSFEGFMKQCVRPSEM